jgi:membrane protein
MHPRELFCVLRDAASSWYEHGMSRMGAALAYYAVFSIAPLLVLAISAAGLVFGEAAARGQVVQQLQDAVGPAVARAVEISLSNVHVTGSGGWGMVFGIATLLIGAACIFGQVQDALNTIWGVKARAGRGILGVLRDRLAPFLMVAVTGSLVLALLLLNLILASLGNFLSRFSLPEGFEKWWLIDLPITLAGMTLLFALVYKVLPDVSLQWRDVWTGAFVTALLFLVGNWLISRYLQWSNVASAYGAAGSLVLILVWVYYGSQVFLFGAEVTRAYALHRGGTREAKACAESLEAQASGAF